jgi:hypothetical protein
LDGDEWGTGREVSGNRLEPSNLPILMLDAVGAPIAEFGDSTGPLKGR